MTADSPSPHAFARWAAENGITVAEAAKAGGCSDAHLRNIFAGRKAASLALAVRLSLLSAGAVPSAAFLKPIRTRRRR